MTCEQARPMLSDALDGELSPTKRDLVSQHLSECAACRAEAGDLRSIRNRLNQLPGTIDPPTDLWPSIGRSLRTPHRESAFAPRTRPSVVPWVMKAAALLLVSVGFFLMTLNSPESDWTAKTLVGRAVVDGSPLTGTMTIGIGRELRTEGESRAELQIGSIGSALIGPHTTIRVVRTSPDQQRMQLGVGSLYASVWSPPRVFIVETPSALAVDLGCTYELEVDSSGVTTLFVLGGEVSLESPDVSSLVLAGHLCESSPGNGPGTPYSETASDDLIRTLRLFDRGDTSPTIVERLVSLSTPDDGVTLLHLLYRTDSPSFDRVYRALSALHPPPASVTRDGTAGRDPFMFEEWINSFTTRFIPLDRTFPSRTILP